MDGQAAQFFDALQPELVVDGVDGWNDLGLGRFELRYLRDKQQREVDSWEITSLILRMQIPLR